METQIDTNTDNISASPPVRKTRPTSVGQQTQSTLTFRAWVAAPDELDAYHLAEAGQVSVGASQWGALGSL